MRSLPTLLAALVATTSLATAQITTATQFVGGPGGLTSCGAFDPPVLCDGVTRASATVQFTYNAGTNTLTVVVENTSPIAVGVPNPVITGVYFNMAPGGVIAMALTNQTGAGGATPTWVLTVDPDLNLPPNPNVANGFGRFHAQLDGSTVNAIANPSAPTWAAPPGTVILGPVTYTFAVFPVPGATLNAGTFAHALSNGPNLNRLVNVAVRFQAEDPPGAVANQGSGIITNPRTCSPSGFMTGIPCLGCPVIFRMSALQICAGCLLVSGDPGPIVVVLPAPTGLVSIPIGAPFEVLINTSIPGPTTVITQNAFIPNDPFLVGATVYGTAAMLNLFTGLFSFSDQFQFVIVA